MSGNCVVLLNEGFWESQMRICFFKGCVYGMASSCKWQAMHVAGRYGTSSELFINDLHYVILYFILVFGHKPQGALGISRMDDGVRM